ncbi:DNA repair protein RadA [Acuticoccus sp. I52.16.1]|uniref:DNA repair protein RadA n=1 Tax=Acuticoccus sp. I52.16.1 TaxID=2928472 RepID=UPI001FD59FEC|nr:DNA repair protein RadA [Acuticoccus sp. I52.16.1]UOM33870.1 DNA repair protein RadA [Acuticoccus sp. I52.16.1]
MAKRAARFVCQECGAVTSRWAGKCEACGEWNTIVEEAATADIMTAATGKTSRAKGRRLALSSLDAPIPEAPRIETGISEFDRVTGGGLVPGSAVLIGGDPGIGKSTLLLQVAATLADTGRRVVYVTGEEATAQVQLRARRLGADRSPVALAAETEVETILETLSAGPPPALVVIDSIQTLQTSIAEAAPGTVTQVRASAQALIRYAKLSGAAVILVGHVTKDGQLAGPRVVEHMVDAVLTFEGDPSHAFRLLRGSKNRFGPTDELGVFEMTGGGLREVANPSELFLGERDVSSPGAAVFAGMEGTRPLLVEVQALVAPSRLGTPRRAVIGWDSSRLSMVLAVLEARCALVLSNYDIYLAVAGGMRIAEPAADLAVAAALISSRAGIALPADVVYFGEVSLSGRVRPVPHANGRLKEATKLGFRGAIVPPQGAADSEGCATSEVALLSDLVHRIAPNGFADERQASSFGDD